MATEEEIRAAMALLEENKPDKAFDELGKTRMGIWAVLCHLSKHEQALTSKEISTAMGVSSARMTVLLKKMEGEGFLKKEHSPSDARAILVELTDKGKQTGIKIEKQRYRCMERILDKYTLVELRAVFEKLDTIHQIFKEELHS